LNECLPEGAFWPDAHHFSERQVNVHSVDHADKKIVALVHSRLAPQLLDLFKERPCLDCHIDFRDHERG
jgi:hypothetical protein